MDFCHLKEIFPTSTEKKLVDAATKTGLNFLKTVTKKVAHKAPEGTGEVIGNKTANKIVKPKPASGVNARNVEEIIIPPEKKKKNIE